MTQYDPLEGYRNRAFERDAAAAVPTSLVKAIVADQRVSPADAKRGMIGAEPTGPDRRGPDGGGFRPFAKDPPGWNVIAGMMDAQDAQDRADRLIEAARRRAALTMEK